jgi:hypothetical protein
LTHPDLNGAARLSEPIAIVQAGWSYADDAIRNWLEMIFAGCGPESGRAPLGAVYQIETLSSKSSQSADLPQQGCWLISARNF